MFMQRKQSVLSLKDKQTIISPLEKGEKGTNLALFFNLQAADLRYMQKQREDPKFHRQHQDEQTIENT